MGRSSEKVSWNIRLAVIKHCAEHLGLDWASKAMTWLVKITGINEMRRTVQNGMSLSFTQPPVAYDVESSGIRGTKFIIRW